MIQTTDDQTELFIVVDQQDKIKEYRTRRECHQDRNLIHRAIDVVLFNTKGEIAFQKRSITKDTSPGFYSVSASGHVSKGESYLQAALREMEEEIGIKNIELEYVTTQLDESPKEKEMFTLFKGVYDGNFKVNKEEVEGIYCLNKLSVAKIKNQIAPCSLASLKILGWI